MQLHRGNPATSSGLCHVKARYCAIRARTTFPRTSGRASLCAGTIPVCRAKIVTGEAYEDVIDILARRAIALTTTTTTNDSDGSPDNTTTNKNNNACNSTSRTAPTPQPTPSAAVLQPVRPVRRVLVGLAGPPGSGKSTLAAEVAARINQLATTMTTTTTTTAMASSSLPFSSPLGQTTPVTTPSSSPSQPSSSSPSPSSPYAVVLPMDGFHYYRRELDAMPDPQAAHARRGAPWTFDAAKFVDAVRRVRYAATRFGSESGFGEEEEVCVPSFDHGVGDPVEGDICIPAGAAVVLVEGNYLLLPSAPWSQLRPLLAESWYLRLPLDTAMQRVLARQRQLGLSREESLTRIATNDRPNAELVEASSAAATLIVTSDVPFRGRTTRWQR
ncbi:hypothetical protein Agub_g6262 [Astrephomene gubernaculifera]|uniref:Phosphoribulokinase/uridine kinase domain-containing protein n=1 Tax=Astrephomene gubernaculifera TaxID=47775 RepID=A0AAD3DN54_9CHLO|nr:hypothetical protein Agub_g6262 [Astrephomene gubernaculifera]